MAKQELTYSEILSSLQKREYKPVYLLMGEEAYYIDLLSDYIQTQVLTEEEKAFNQTVLYGKETDMVSLIEAARRYPMQSPYQVIIVKEAQQLKDIDKLTFYLQSPSPKTVLVLCHKHGTVDKRKKVVAEIAKKGVVFVSPALRDYQVLPWIKDYVRSKALSIDEKAISLLVEFLGTDLARIAGEIEKLIITKGADTKVITADLIEKNIGLSKEYNNFELQNALINRDILKANRIVSYAQKNPKAMPFVMTVSMLFGFYANLLLYHYTVDKSDGNLASRLGVNPYFVRDYRKAAQTCSALKCMQNISLLREFDARSKGVNSHSSDAELLKELVFKLLH